jgi:WD40 repeat protein
MRIWDPASGRAEAALGERIHPMSTVAFAPDGTWLATASEGETVQIWDIARGFQRATLIGHSDGVTAIAIAPNGTWLASASLDRTIRIWEPGTGATRALMRVDRPLKACTWSSSGQVLAAAGDAGLYLFTFLS